MQVNAWGTYQPIGLALKLAQACMAHLAGCMHGEHTCIAYPCLSMPIHAYQCLSMPIQALQRHASTKEEGDRSIQYAWKLCPCNNLQHDVSRKVSFCSICHERPATHAVSHKTSMLGSLSANKSGLPKPSNPIRSAWAISPQMIISSSPPSSSSMLANSRFSLSLFSSGSSPSLLSFSSG